MFSVRGGTGNLLVGITFINLIISPTAHFSGNTAGNGAFNSPANAHYIMPLAASISVSTHQINNYDINFSFEPYRMTGAAQQIAGMQSMAQDSFISDVRALEPLSLDTYTIVTGETIGISVLVNGNFVPVASQVVDAVSAVDWNGNCAIHFVQVGDAIEVSKNADWHTMVLSVTVNGSSVDVILANPLSNADLYESMEMYESEEPERLELIGFAATSFEPMAQALSTATIIQTETRTYNAFNQLIRFENDDTIATYTYRTDGLRHSKVVNGATTTHVWNRGHIVLERNAAGGVVQRYYRSLNGRLIRSYHHGFYLYNVRGDVKQRTNAQGVIIATYRYSAFGVQLNLAVSSTNRFRFAGEYWDAHRGEYYLRARSFNPRLGRFTQPDPHWGLHNMIFGDSPRIMNDRHDPFGRHLAIVAPNVWAITQAGNLFVYTMHNPVFFNDSSGLFATPANIIGGLVGAGLGAIIGLAIADYFDLTGWRRATVIGGGALLVGAVGWFAGPAVVNIASHTIASLVTAGSLALTSMPTWIVDALNLGSRFAKKTASNISGSSNMIPHLLRHTPSGGWKNKAKFTTDSALDINNLIARGLNMATNFSINSHDSFKTIVDMGSVVGTKGEQFLKIVFTAAGEIITAYPVKRGL